MGGNSSGESAAAAERFGSVPARRAAVVPRVRLAQGDGEVLPIEDRVIGLLRRGVSGVVTLAGPPGSGKSTALAHLAAVLPPDAPVRLVDAGADDDDAARRAVDAAARTHLVVAVPSAFDFPSIARLVMAPWGDDDVIEYLLAAHRPQCQAVMFKVKSYARHLALDGSPDLWRMVLDTLAADPSIPDVPVALRRCLAPLLSDPKLAAAVACLTLLRRDMGIAVNPPARLDPSAERLVRHRPVQLLLASELIVRNLCDGVGWADLEGKLPRDLILETARLAAHWPAAVRRLGELVAGNKRRTHPMAASLLVAIRPEWRPPADAVPTLSGAYVPGAHWAGVDLHGGALSGADLERADLSNANLTGATATVAALRGASLRGATLDKLCALGSDFAGAQLAGASAAGADLGKADLHGADLRGINLSGADLSGADLTDAVLTSAVLREAVLDGTKVDGADLVGADLSGAVLKHVDLTGVNLAGTRFARAELTTCCVQGISLPKGDFAGATLKGCYLTGAVMPGADFHDADLRDTGLADVEWEGADLRDADLRGASFHMGSTRSGLVGSAVPCEGSKTGFYTDDFNDRDFKSPEEIRKANLCGADLRGAKLKGVDFYLVDLRGARYTDHQAHHFRRCGAILD